MPSDTPELLNYGVFVQPGTENSLVIKSEAIQSSDAIHGIGLHYRECYLDTERHLKYYTHYSYFNCFLECSANYTFEVKPSGKLVLSCSQDLLFFSCLAIVILHNDRKFSTSFNLHHLHLIISKIFTTVVLSHFVKITGCSAEIFTFKLCYIVNQKVV